MACKICSSDLDLDHRLLVKEMMFGTKREFVYYNCPSCGCLQIENPPEDIDEFYPHNYYVQNKPWINISNLKKRLWHFRSRLAMTELYWLLKLLNQPDILSYVYFAQIKSKSKILDVGCGNGDLLNIFYLYGFRCLVGIDPYLKNEFRSDYLNLCAKSLMDINGKFDLIIFNHSFEHIWNQEETLLKAKNSLTDGGFLLLKMPIVNYAFDIYKENWVQIDAPRHFVIHSEKSLKILCEKVSIKVNRIIYDSTEFQFMGSEQFARGISSTGENSYLSDLSKSIFSDNDKKKYIKQAKELNRNRRGDQAAFYIRKI